MSRGQFAGVLQETNSPAFEVADNLYNVCLQNGGVNPAVALAFFYRLSRCGTSYADPAKVQNRNWGEIAGDGQGVGGVQAYPSWEQGLIDWCRISANVLGVEGLTTLSAVAPRLQPAGAADPAGFARSVSELITQWKAHFDTFGFVLAERGFGDWHPVR